MGVKTNVKAYREKLGMSQQKLSDLSGVGRSTVSNIETGKYIPGVDIALMLAKALRCRVEDIFALQKGEE